jgi:hypothetical protein
MQQLRYVTFLLPLFVPFCMPAGMAQQVTGQDIDKILERADKLLDEAKAGYEDASSKGAVPGFIDAGFKLEEARIKYLVLQEIGSADKQKVAADRLRAVNQLSKLIHDGKVAVGGTPAEPAPVKSSEPGPEKKPPQDTAALKAPVDVSKRAPVPDANTQQQAERLVKDLFKDQYAKKAAPDRKVLARQLLEQAIKSRDDVAAQWVLYREAQDAAVQGVDAKAAVEAIESAARVYDIDPLPMKSQALMAIGKTAKAPEDLIALTEALLSLVDELVRADQFDSADKAAAAALQHARKSTDGGSAVRVAARAKDISEAKAQFQGLKKVLETLAKTPDDGDANTEMGRYLCLVKGSWDLGLRFLMRSSDAALKALADKEAALPTQSAERMNLADGWYDLGDKEKNQFRKIQLFIHSRALYESALDGATALARARMEKRLESLQYVGALPGQPGGPGSIDITTLTVKKSSVGAGKLGINPSDGGTQVYVNGKECKRYIFAHAPSMVVFDVPAGARLFQATGAKPVKSQGDGTWKYLVVVDAKTIYESKALNEYKGLEVEISVALPPGAKEIQLKVDDLGGPNGDHAVWAYPRFQK